MERLGENGTDPGNFEFPRLLYLNHHEPHTASEQIESAVISLQVVIQCYLVEQEDGGMYLHLFASPFQFIHHPTITADFTARYVFPSNRFPSIRAYLFPAPLQ